MTAGERAHVLDDAADAQEAAARHVGRTGGHLLRRECRSGDDQQIGAGQHAGEPHLHVAGAGRHVDEQVVERSPVHVVQELLDGLGEHQAPPHQRRVLTDQEAGADHLEQSLRQAAADRDLVGDDLRLRAALHGLGLEGLVDPQQSRHREAPDVGVEDADGEAQGRHCGGEVHRDRALPDATLATGDREYATGDRDLRVGRSLAGVPSRLEQHVGAFLARHLAPLDVHGGDTGVDSDPALDVLLDLRSQRAAADRQLHRDDDGTVRADLNGGHHAEGHDVGAELWVDHRREQAPDLVDRRRF